jgi:hypothetical protein
MKLGVFTVGLPDLTPEEAVRELSGPIRKFVEAQ